MQSQTKYSPFRPPPKTMSFEDFKNDIATAIATTTVNATDVYLSLSAAEEREEGEKAMRLFYKVVDQLCEISKARIQRAVESERFLVNNFTKSRTEAFAKVFKAIEKAGVAEVRELLLEADAEMLIVDDIYNKRTKVAYPSVFYNEGDDRLFIGFEVAYDDVKIVNISVSRVRYKTRKADLVIEPSHPAFVRFAKHLKYGW